jgi:two-component system phosphate regulon sensor histidine kinase PhoR
MQHSNEQEGSRATTAAQFPHTRRIATAFPVWHRGGVIASRFPRWPLVLFLAGTGLAAVAVIDALSAVRSQQRVAAEALVGYSNFAAWSYRQHLREVMTAAAREVLGSVNHGAYRHMAPMIPDAGDLYRYLHWDRSCLCHVPEFGPRPRAFLGFSLHGDTLGVAFAERKYTPADRAWILDTLKRQVENGDRSDWGFTYVAGHHDGVPRYFAYTLMPTAWGDTIVYGVEYDRTAFAEFVGSALDVADLLPSTFTRSHTNRQLLTVQVSGADQSVIYASDARPRWRYDATATLPKSYGGIETRAEIRPEYAGVLVIGGLPRSHLPFLLTLLVLATGLSVVAIRQLQREGELGRLRADFVANVSHELRTPLAQMRLDLDTVRLGRYTSEGHRSVALERVDRETRRLTFLAENVLRFSRRGRASESGERLPTDVAAETARIVEEFRPLAGARRAGVEIETAGAPVAMLDRDALRHIVLNLLDNAAKYGPTGQTIRVGVHNSGGTVRVSVTDQGPGVPYHELELIWQPFRRGSGAVRQGTGGSGMGLSIVLDIVEQHAGQIHVQNAVTGGAIFTVELPCLAS